MKTKKIKNPKSRIINCFCLFIWIFFSGCDDKSRPIDIEEPDIEVTVTGLKVSPSSISLEYGDTPDSQQITVEAIPENATPVSISWSSENEEVVSVSQTGLVTATGAGSTNVIVKADGYSQTIPVTVSCIGLDTNSIAFETKGGTQTVTVTGLATDIVWYVDYVSHSWITAVRVNSTTLRVTAAPNSSETDLAGEVIVKTTSGISSFTLSVTQAPNLSHYLGAVTEMGRRFVTGSSGMVVSVTSDVQYAINDEVSALEIAFTSTATGSLQPFSVFLLDVKLENGTTLRATAADDEDASINSTSTKVQIVRGQLAAMQNKRSAELEVLAGVNGDFFAMGGTNYPTGVMYRGGVCLKNTFQQGYSNVFALLKDGTARIITQAQYAAFDKSEILEAISGSEIFLSNGVNQFNDAELQPRTVAGISKERNRVFLMVVDGRQNGYSVGGLHSMMSKMLLAMGAHEAFKFDGGGSSTFVIKTSSEMPATQNSFETRNRPSDVSERAVANGIAIVKIK